MRHVHSIAGLFALGVAEVAFATVLPTVSSGTVRLQLDADTGTTVSGSTVNSWTDAAHSVTFSRQNGDPALVTGAMNGQSVIRFTSGNGYDRLIDAALGSGLGPVLTGQQLTIFAVTKNTTSLNGLLDSNRNGGDSLRYAFDVVQVPSGGPNNDIIAASGGSVTTFRLSLKDDPSTGPTTPVRSFESFLRAGSTPGTLYDHDFATNNSLTHGFGLVEMGTINNGGAGATNNFNGDLAEFVIYSGALTDSDRFLIEETLAGSYAIPEPSTAALLAPLVLLGMRRRR